MLQRPGRSRVLAVSFVLVLLASACGSDDADVDADDAAEDAVAESEVGPDAGGLDGALERSDVDCSEDGLGSSDETEFYGAHWVVDGALGAVCFGDEDPSLIAAWEALSLITPPGQLGDLGLFGGFVSGEDGDEVTLAFVNALDADGTLFQMSVNLDSYDEDPNEAQLTMAHEFSHVFTALPSQLDRTAEAADSCATFYSGEGCYTDDSIMWQWIDRFWGDGLIDEIDPFVDASGAGGEERCAANPGFFGAYAASSPEEDFAETFSAFVYRLEPGSTAQQAKMDWIADQPGLAEFRERAVAAGLGPLQNNFDNCGTG
jgi:Putative zinc-binding metallo-peptidase